MVLGYLKVSSFQPNIQNGASLKNSQKNTDFIKIAKGIYFFASHPFLPRIPFGYFTPSSFYLNRFYNCFKTVI